MRLLGEEAIDDPQSTIAALSQVIVVGHDEERFAAPPRQAEEQINDCVTSFGIEVAARFIGKNDAGIVR